MSSPQIQDFPLLLEVYREGLRLGLISRDEIIAWADDIIVNTDEPDYFFIELSLSHDVNRLIETINTYVKQSNNPICDRVLLGLVYHRKPIYDVNEIEKVAALLGSMYSWDGLTSFENNTLITFDDYYTYYFPDLTQLQVEIINFLAIYKAFTLENFKEWPAINEHVLELLKEEEIKVNIVNEANRKAWAEKDRKRKIKRQLTQIAIVVLFLGFFVGLVMVSNNDTFPSFYYFFVLYFILRGGYGWWKKRKSR